jgi:hypothetical protein
MLFLICIYVLTLNKIYLLTKAAAGGKKAKKEEADEEPKTVHDHIATLKAADAGKPKKHKVDDKIKDTTVCDKVCQ